MQILFAITWNFTPHESKGATDTRSSWLLFTMDKNIAALHFRKSSTFVCRLGRYLNDFTLFNVDSDASQLSFCHIASAANSLHNGICVFKKNCVVLLDLLT